MTAAARGIGRAIALRFAEEGASVLALDRDEGHLAALQHPRIATRTADAADATTLAEVLGNERTDILANCIGWVPQGTLLQCTVEDWRLAFQLNVDSFFHAIRLLLPGMRDARSGAIVNIASLAGLRAAPNRAAYSATKAAIIGLTRSVAIDYAAEGIRCNAICPAMVDTPSLQDRIAAMPDPTAARAMFASRHPVGRLGRPEEVAALAAYLVGPESEFMTGAILQLDGGAGA